MLATPRLSARDSAAERETQFGWRFTPYDGAQTRRPHFEVNLDAVRRETADGGEAEHGVMLRSSVHW